MHGGDRIQRVPSDQSLSRSRRRWRRQQRSSRPRAAHRRPSAAAARPQPAPGPATATRRHLTLSWAVQALVRFSLPHQMCECVPVQKCMHGLYAWHVCMAPGGGVRQAPGCAAPHESPPYACPAIWRCCGLRQRSKGKLAYCEAPHRGRCHVKGFWARGVWGASAPR